MENFSIQSIENRAVITVDLSFMNIESLNRFFERLRAEQLIRKANFSDEIAEIGSEIKENWWQKNREAYLEGINNADIAGMRNPETFSSIRPMQRETR